MTLRAATLVVTISLSSIATADIDGSAVAYLCSNNEVHGVCTAEKESTDPYNRYYLEKCRLQNSSHYDEVVDKEFVIGSTSDWSGNFVAILPAACNVGFGVQMESEFRKFGGGPPDPVAVNDTGTHLHSCGCPTC